MYFLCGLMDMVCGVFDRGRKDDVFFWNLMIFGCNRMKLYEESLRFFMEMERKLVILIFVILFLVFFVCFKVRDKDFCKRVYGYVSECMREFSLKLVNVLVNVYVVCGEMNIVVRIFNSMKIRDVIFWIFIVKGFVDIGNLELVRMYFDDMLVRDRIFWIIMIYGYFRVDCFNEFLDFFREM